MKLKLIAASISMLGLVSYPAFAHQHRHHTHCAKHHCHHHHIHASAHVTHHEVVAAPVLVHEYNTEVVETCRISHSSLILNASTQNIGRAMPNPCQPGWFNRVRMAGGVNVDFGKWGNRNANYEGENYKRVSINDAYLNIGATINEWSNAFASLSYSDTGVSTGSSTTTYGMYSWDYNYSNVYRNKLSVEQAFATFGPAPSIPLYLQLGKQFQDFGRYQIHPITRSMTQVLSETLATSGKLALIFPNGFDASISVFNDQLERAGGSNPTNYNLAIGYNNFNPSLGWSVGAGYLYNMTGVNDVGEAVEHFSDEGFHHRVSALALYGDVNSGPFLLSGRYTTALQSFNAWDLPRHGRADLGVNPFEDSIVLPDASGAKPWAAGIMGSYNFDAMGHAHTLFLGYENSGEAAGVGLPQKRFSLGVNCYPWQQSIVGIEWDHDKGYSESNGGNNKSTDLVSLRIGTQF